MSQESTYTLSRRDCRWEYLGKRVCPRTDCTSLSNNETIAQKSKQLQAPSHALISSLAEDTLPRTHVALPRTHVSLPSQSASHMPRSSPARPRFPCAQYPGKPE